MQFHYPGTNYLGPGTHVIDRISNDTLPTSKTDFVALLHDIQYLQSRSLSMDESDTLAIMNSDDSLQGLTMQIGLSLRKFFGLKMNKTDRPIASNLVGNRLMEYVTDPSSVYFKYFRKYNVDIHNYK